jgi:hypothetical protein
VLSHQGGFEDFAGSDEAACVKWLRDKAPDSSMRRMYHNHPEWMNDLQIGRELRVPREKSDLAKINMSETDFKTCKTFKIAGADFQRCDD